MNITISQDAIPVIALAGKLDTAHATAFEEAIAPLLCSETKDVIIDCTQLEYISSSGLRQFLVLQKNITAKKGSLIIRHLTPDIKEIFDLTNFSKIFKIE